LINCTERRAEALGVRVAHDHAIGHLEQQLRVLALRVGVGHVEAQVHDHLFRGRVNAVGVAVGGLQLALVQQHLDVLLLAS
jgi:hypothetical protein